MPAKNAGTGTEPVIVDATRPPAVDRITVALIPKAGEDLQRLQDRTCLSKTDIANRAITLYEFIDEELASGAQLLLRRSDGATYRVELR